jgi:hypothetical protein
VGVPVIGNESPFGDQHDSGIRGWESHAATAMSSALSGVKNPEIAPKAGYKPSSLRKRNQASEKWSFVSATNRWYALTGTGRWLRPES